MTNQPSVSQLEKVAQRIREMREIMGYSTSKMAELTEISEELYCSYESGSVEDRKSTRLNSSHSA